MNKKGAQTKYCQGDMQDGEQKKATIVTDKKLHAKTFSRLMTTRQNDNKVVKSQENNKDIFGDESNYSTNDEISLISQRFKQVLR